MSDSRKQRDGQSELEAPQGLAEDLAALYALDVPVPPEVDRAIVATARERFARKRHPRLVLRWGTVGAFAAAAAVIVLFLLPALLVRPMDKASREAAETLEPDFREDREDIDRNGRVDILDAFILARHIKSAGRPRDEWDMNGDGALDRTDVDMIARAAVSLERSSVQ